MTPNEFFDHVQKTSDFEVLRGFHPKLGKYLLEYDAEDGMIMNLYNSEAIPVDTIALQCDAPFKKVHEHILAAIRWNNEKLTQITVTKKPEAIGLFKEIEKGNNDFFGAMASIFKPVHQEDYLRENLPS